MQEKFRIALAIFVKTPGISALKTRLAVAVGEKKAIDFYELSCKATEEVTELFAVSMKEYEVQSLYAVAERAGMQNNLWKNLECVYQGSGDLGNRLCHVWSELASSFDGIVFLGADSPQISISILNKACDLILNEALVVGPAKDGGFYLFGGNSDLDPSFFREVTYSEEDTLQQLLSYLPGKISFLEPLNDIDELSDLMELRETMSSLMKKTTAQQRLIDWLKLMKV